MLVAQTPLAAATPLLVTVLVATTPLAATTRSLAKLLEYATPPVSTTSLLVATQVVQWYLDAKTPSLVQL
jgi:hypothetical protein